MITLHELIERTRAYTDLEIVFADGRIYMGRVAYGN